MNIDSVVLRQDLIDALEGLMQAVLAVSNLPETVYTVNMGVRCQSQRTEVIAPGYGARERADEATIAFMISSILFNAVWFPSSLLELNGKPDVQAVKHAEKIVSEYKSSLHPAL